jgi:hypothetical protein
MFRPTLKSLNIDRQITILARPLREWLTRPSTIRRDTERVTEKRLETIAQGSFGIIWTRPLVGDLDVGGTRLVETTGTRVTEINRLCGGYDFCARKCWSIKLRCIPLWAEHTEILEVGLRIRRGCSGGIVGDHDIGGITLVGITMTGKVVIVMGVVRVFPDYDLCASKC